jgi:hypothetical protein
VPSGRPTRTASTTGSRARWSEAYRPRGPGELRTSGSLKSRSAPNAHEQCGLARPPQIEEPAGPAQRLRHGLSAGPSQPGAESDNEHSLSPLPAFDSLSRATCPEGSLSPATSTNSAPPAPGAADSAYRNGEDCGFGSAEGAVWAWVVRRLASRPFSPGHRLAPLRSSPFQSPKSNGGPEEQKNQIPCTLNNPNP